MNDLPVFLQVFLRAFALLAVGLWMQTLAASGKKDSEQPSGADKGEHASRDTGSSSERSPAKQPEQHSDK